MSSERIVDHAFRRLRADAMRAALLLALTLAVLAKALGLTNALLAEPLHYYVPPTASLSEKHP